MQPSFLVPIPLSSEQLAQVHAALPKAATNAVSAIRARIPAYSGAVVAPAGFQRAVERATTTTLGGFIDAAAGVRDVGTTIGPIIRGAYLLGRNEAKAGRPIDAIQAAYRIGGREAWAGMGDALLAIGVTPRDLVELAGALFEYLDELATASASGYAHEVETVFRDRQIRRDRLARELLSGAGSRESMIALAVAAEWTPPTTLTVVIVEQEHAGDLRPWIDQRALFLDVDDVTLILIPDADSGSARAHLTSQLEGRRAIVGPAVDWFLVSDSRDQAIRLARLVKTGVAMGDPALVENFQVHLVVRANEAGHAALRRRVLAPLDAVRPATRERLIETLRSWLLHALSDRRREAVAEALFVHPQTVRYRVGQLRELFGDRLSDPDYVRDLVVALT